ncbi:M28 family peptidase [Treponema sp.]|uniref:M28 family peptidase n=1 Tax=Treponema sp. TaxID=166 RepID=UPI00298E6C26|nr:M28 family peptidase [Treponema sp.]MCQ2240488.1 M28 family metallopeptidase [Treponema sp.]
MGFLPEDFSIFISRQCNRVDFIQSWLKAHGVESKRLSIDGKNHILVQFESRFYNPRFRIKTVVAHHDRVEGSPGANDNSAAVWQLMNWAVNLKNYPDFHNVRIFFTDGEELGSNTGVTEQGAFGIASTFQRLGIKDDVYVFDACGRGEVPVLARLNLGPKTPASFVKTASDLYVRTLQILKTASPKKWMTLPIAYSDNASFLACGIPAVAITMLPSDEASLYAMHVSENGTLESKVLNRERAKENEGSLKELLPLTWRLFHSEKDSEEFLTPESFQMMESILRVLAFSKTPA